MKSLDFIYSLLFTSLFGVLAINSLLIYAMLKNKVFVHYFVLVIGLSTYMSLGLFVEPYPSLADHFSIVSAMICVAGGVLFTSSFIGLERRKYHLWWNLLRSIYWGSLAVGFSQLINISFFLDDVVANFLSYIAASLALLLIVLGFSLTILLWRKEANAKLYLIINSPMMIASLALIIAWFASSDGLGSDVEHTNSLKFGFAGGMVLQMILFSVFVGLKIKNAEREKLELERDINKRLSEEIQMQTRLMALAKDEVEEQRNELKQLNELKNKLFLLVAHDLKNPLQHLLNMVNVMESKVVTEKDKILITHQAKEEMSESITIIDRLLNWSYRQLDGIKVQKETFSLVKAVDESVSEWSSIIEKKSIKIKKELDCEAIHFDKDMLRVIFRNLISNAIKFSYEGGTVRITSICDDDHLIVGIKDEGLGMNPQWFEELTSQGTPNVKKGTKGEKGNGFGLIITKDFVEMNDGQLLCESQAGKGTLFTIKLTSKMAS